MGNNVPPFFERAANARQGRARFSTLILHSRILRAFTIASLMCRVLRSLDRSHRE